MAHADVNAANEHGNTPLHYALFWRYTDVVDRLIKGGAHVRQRHTRNAIRTQYNPYIYTDTHTTIYIYAHTQHCIYYTDTHNTIHTQTHTHAHTHTQRERDTLLLTLESVAVDFK